jgi:hypothetical protein
VSTVPRDKARRNALLKAELFVAAWSAIEKLNIDQCEAIYLRLEERIADAMSADDAAAATEPPSEKPSTSALVSAPEEKTPASNLPMVEAKRRAAEDVERERLARFMEQADGCVTDAAELAGMDRSNFRRRLQHLGLRVSGKKKPGPRYTDLILKILDENRQGLRLCEIAKRTRQAGPNAFKTLKLLEQQGRVEQHGKRSTSLWTLPGIVPVQRVESIPAIVVDVLAKDRLPMEQRLIARRVETVLRARGRKLNEATLRQEITRLIEKGIVAFHGANEHGPMFALTLPKGGSDLN